MKALKLIQDKTPEFCGLIESFESLLESYMEVSRSTYGVKDRLLCIYVDNVETGSQMRIVYDPNGAHASRQGVHTTLEIDEYELAEMLERAFSDGFDTIWIH